MSEQETLMLVMDREEAGVVIDALIEHAHSARQRKRRNSASTSDVRVEMCEDLIRRVTREAATDRATQIRLAAPAPVPGGVAARKQEADRG
jgi:hypothetical protein